MNTIERREKLKAKLKDKKYRDAFVSEHIDTGIPFQIRAIRKQREWTQKELADHAGMLQERISVAENPNYSKFNLKTLKKIASAFDVALIVRFVPINELVDWELKLSSEALQAVSFDEDPYFREAPRGIRGSISASLPQINAKGLGYVGQVPQPGVADVLKFSPKQKPYETMGEFQKEERPLQKAIAGASQ